jgi:hypothetical protein
MLAAVPHLSTFTGLSTNTRPRPTAAHIAKPSNKQQPRKAKSFAKLKWVTGLQLLQRQPRQHAAGCDTKEM